MALLTRTSIFQVPLLRSIKMFALSRPLEIDDLKHWRSQSHYTNQEKPKQIIETKYNKNSLNVKLDFLWFRKLSNNYRRKKQDGGQEKGN